MSYLAWYTGISAFLHNAMLELSAISTATSYNQSDLHRMPKDAMLSVDLVFLVFTELPHNYKAGLRGVTRGARLTVLFIT